METSQRGPDPVDGLRLAMLQQRRDQLRARLRFRTFGIMEGLLLLMLACGVAIVVTGEHGRYLRIQHLQHLVLGWALIIQAFGLWWAARRSALQELRRLEQRIETQSHRADAAVVAAAAAAARTLLLRKP